MRENPLSAAIWRPVIALMSSQSAATEAIKASAWPVESDKSGVFLK